MKIIFLELNEVPDKVMQKFVGTQISGSYSSKYDLTISEDVGHLSPWITWATIHRGVSNQFHGINDINQNVDEIDLTYPTLFQTCIDRGFSVGLANTMHSGILAEKKDSSYKFLLPEAFSINSFCIPKSLESFQKFNLAMSRGSSRVVSTSLPKKVNLIKSFFSYFQNTKRLRALREIIKQLIKERILPHTKVRRRTIQSDLIFDIFVSLVKKESPDLSVLFTNHVASSMHRFWEATFPEDYVNQVSSDSWIKKYKDEIPFSMKTAKDYINILKSIVDSSDNTQLWIASGMGQESVQNYVPQDYFWDISNMSDYVSSCLGKQVKVTALPQMIPLYSFSAKKEIINEFCEFIKSNKNLYLRKSTEKTVAFGIDNQKKEIILNGSSIIPKGIVKKNIDEKTSSAAYHMPEGFLLRYGPKLSNPKSNMLNKNGKIRTHHIKDFILSTLGS